MRILTLTAIQAIALLTLAAAQPDELQGRMRAVLEYTGVASPSPADVARMSELWTRAQQPGLSREDRRLAFREMYTLFGKLRGRDLSANAQALDGLSQFVTATVEAGGRMDLALPEPRGTPSGAYVHFETRGSGSTPLLLIADLGTDGRSLYDSFVTRQSAAYTIHIATLPYAGSARPLPWPERLDYGARPWLSQIEQELLAFVDQPRMNGITVLGTAAGGYFSARLGLLRPARVRSVVVVNALVATSLRSPSDPDAPGTPADRQMLLKSVAPTPQLVPIAAVPPADELRKLVADPASMHPTARNWMAFAVKDPAVSQAWTFDALTKGFLVPSLEYRWELTSTDLTEELRGLSVPMLAMGSWQDEGSPVRNTPNISQWEEMKLRYPKMPLTVIAFDDTRSYISADAPAEFDRALADFLAGRRPRGKTISRPPGAGARASITGTAGRAEIGLEFDRPAVKGARIWGAQVPYGRVWSPGANQATTFTISRDVRIDGRPLPAGRYTFFAIPRETEWTLIFNRVPRQWAASDYNPAFDALRLTVKAAEAPMTEYLTFAAQAAAGNALVITFAWETRTFAFRVESK